MLRGNELPLEYVRHGVTARGPRNGSAHRAADTSCGKLTRGRTSAMAWDRKSPESELSYNPEKILDASRPIGALRQVRRNRKKIPARPYSQGAGWVSAMQHR